MPWKVNFRKQVPEKSWIALYFVNALFNCLFISAHILQTYLIMIQHHSIFIFLNSDKDIHFIMVSPCIIFLFQDPENHTSACGSLSQFSTNVFKKGILKLTCLTATTYFWSPSACTVQIPDDRIKICPMWCNNLSVKILLIDSILHTWPLNSTLQRKSQYSAIISELMQIVEVLMWRSLALLLPSRAWSLAATTFNNHSVQKI